MLSGCIIITPFLKKSIRFSTIEVAQTVLKQLKTKPNIIENLVMASIVLFKDGKPTKTFKDAIRFY